MEDCLAANFLPKAYWFKDITDSEFEYKSIDIESRSQIIFGTGIAKLPDSQDTWPGQLFDYETGKKYTVWQHTSEQPFLHILRQDNYHGDDMYLFHYGSNTFDDWRVYPYVRTVRISGDDARDGNLITSL